MSEPAPADLDATVPPPPDVDTHTIPPAPSYPVAAPAAVPGYEILSELGRGGMGVVYLARHLQLNRTVALKMVLSGGHASPTELTRFLAEAEAVAALQHPNVVQIFETGSHAGLPYISLEYVDGGSLADKVRDQPLAAREAAALVEPIARGVQAAHDHGIIHRDLKPENILLASHGACPRGAGQEPRGQAPWLAGAQAVPKITDFGLAKRVAGGSGLTQTGAIMGTPSYMAPEQAAGEPSRVSGRVDRVGPAADVYAVGAILYRLVAGRPPFQAATPVDTMLQVVSEEPVPPSRLAANLPRDLETICLKCLQKEPAKRYASASALADDLQRFLKGEPIVARQVSQLERGVKWVRRNKAVSGLVATVMFALLLGSAGMYWKYRDAKKQEGNAKYQEGLATTKAGELSDALQTSDERAKELTYQLALSDVLLSQSAFESNNVAVARERLDRVPPELRRWEWHYLRREYQGGLFKLYGHTSWVTSVAFSPDGSRIVTGSRDKTARVWDVHSGAHLCELKGHTDDVTSVAFSSDGSRIVTASKDKTARVWHAQSGATLRELKGHSSEVWSVAFDPDGSRIVTASHDNTARVWSTNTGITVCELKGHTGHVTGVVFSPDGSRIVTGSWDGTARVWDSHSGMPLRKLAGPSGPTDFSNLVTSVAFSPDGSRIVTGSVDNTTRVWDAHNGTTLRELKGHVEYVTSVAFSPDGSRIVTGSIDKTARVWDAHSGAQLRELKGHTGYVMSVAFSPDGSRIVTGNANEACVWDAHSGTPLRELKGHSRIVSGVAVSPDGSYIVTGNNGNNENTALLWDTHRGMPLREFRGHADYVTCVAFSPEGSRVATGSDDKTARVWDTCRSKFLRELKGHSRSVTGVAFSPDGSCIVTGSADNTARVWDAHSGTTLCELQGHTGPVLGVGFSPDGSRIVTGSRDNTARVWHAHSGTPIRELKGHTNSVTSVAFSPNGSQIVTGSNDGTAQVWDTQGVMPRREFKGHTEIVSSVAFSPDGSRIVTGSRDKTARVWDVHSGTPLRELKGHTSEMTSVAFSPDGSRIVTGSSDTTARVWDSEPNNESDQLSYRLFWTRPRPDRHRDDLDAARKAGDAYAVAFHLDRLLAYLPDERTALLAERAKMPVNHLVAARLQRIANRLQAEKLLAANQPGPALPLLHVSLLARKYNQPPVEEFLIAEALLALNKPDEAKRYYRAAIEWLDKAQVPMRMTNAVSAGFAGPLQMLANVPPAGDPRYNEFDWESWHESDVFRARVERKLRIQ